MWYALDHELFLSFSSLWHNLSLVLPVQRVWFQSFWGFPPMFLEKAKCGFPILECYQWFAPCCKPFAFIFMKVSWLWTRHNFFCQSILYLSQWCEGNFLHQRKDYANHHIFCGLSGLLKLLNSPGHSLFLDQIVNLATPKVFASSPINLFYFVQSKDV